MTITKKLHDLGQSLWLDNITRTLLSDGTLRYLLARPVGRTRLLVAKLVSVTVFTLITVIAVAAAATAGVQASASRQDNTLNHKHATSSKSRMWKSVNP